MNRKIIVFFVFLSLFFAMFALPDVRKVSTLQNENPIVIIDAGHGGFDGGAVSKSGVLEKELNLSISQKLCDLLSFMGVQTCMTRGDDNPLGIAEASVRRKKISDMNARVEKINKIENGCLISIHLNHFSDPDCSGAQVFYANNDKSKLIADFVQTALKNGVNKNNGRVPQVAGRHIFLLNNINCPGILVECGFLSNPDEERLLKAPDYQRKIALSIAVGFLDSYKDVLNYENKNGFCV